MSTKIKRALEKLHVKSGGRGTCQIVSHDLELCMFEGDEGTYDLRARFRGKPLVVALPKDRVHTKGRSPWRRDNTWRLTPDAVAFYTANIRDTLKQVAKKTAHKRWASGEGWVPSTARRRR